MTMSQPNSPLALPTFPKTHKPEKLDFTVSYSFKQAATMCIRPKSRQQHQPTIDLVHAKVDLDAPLPRFFFILVCSR